MEIGDIVALQMAIVYVMLHRKQKYLVLFAANCYYLLSVFRGYTWWCLSGDQIQNQQEITFTFFEAIQHFSMITFFSSEMV